MEEDEEVACGGGTRGRGPLAGRENFVCAGSAAHEEEGGWCGWHPVGSAGPVGHREVAKGEGRVL